MTEYRNRVLIFILLASLFIFCKLAMSHAAEPGKDKGLLNPALVNKYYIINNKPASWLSSPQLMAQIRSRFIEVLDNASSVGLNKDKYHYAAIKASISETDTAGAYRRNNVFLDGLVSYTKDLYEGNDIAAYLSNDEISSKYATFDDNFILNKLGAVTSVSDFNAALASLEPADPEYLQMKTVLKTELDSGKTKNAELVGASMNFYRWIRHFHFDQYIVVNIPTATLHYYQNGRPTLQMRVVTGKPKTPTPLFTAYCTDVVMYPYWNVPRSIAVKELIPKFKKKPGAIDKLNMQVITKSGEPVDYSSINWSQYDTTSFPYVFRQYTGCENSLGVLKFNLTDPFDVYLHDTNQKGLFAKSSRYFSHGCIRLEKPFELGSYLTDNTLDTSFLRSCAVGQTPQTTKLKKPVPVFVVYMPAAAGETNKVALHKDVYKLF